jgi:FkbM family methyltransferase
MNRRLRTLFYWLADREHVRFGEMLRFLARPMARAIARRYIERIDEEPDSLICRFRGVPGALVWPKACGRDLLDLVVAETFDERNWHYKTHAGTPVTAGEALVDVGAAEGLFSLSVLPRCARVALIEPNPVFVAALRRTFAGEIPGKVTIHPVAAGETEGRAALAASGLSSKVEHGESGRVLLVPLDRLLADFGRVTFIKADVEGDEMKMLAGARELIRRDRPKLAITCYHQGNDYREMIRFVSGLVPDYRFNVKGITHYAGRPVMLHGWVPGSDHGA